MGTLANRLTALDSASSADREFPDPSAAASRDTETASSSRYILPKDLDAAIKHLDDQQLDRLVSTALEERARRKQSLLPRESPRQRNAEAVFSPLPQGKLNAVRAAFKAGVTPSRIAREFGISQQDVRSALKRDAKKQ
jgi:hypothetical protein